MKRRTKTRAPGVYKSVSGRYEIQYRDPDGRLRFKVVEGGLEDAKAQRADIIGRIRKGESVRPSKSTFGDFAEDWIASLNRRPRTIDAYRYALDRHLLPRFRGRKLADITVDDVARLVADMQRKGYAAWTISGTLSTLSGCLGKAARRGLIATNPTRALASDERPKQRGREKRVLDEKEISAVLEGASERFRIPIAVMIFAGLRLSEMLALRWSDVDFGEGFLRIRYQLNPKRELVELKSDSGRREIVLIPQLATMLKRYRMASRYKDPADFLFPAPDGRGRDQRSTARGVERALEAAGLSGQGISSHSFRHTFASLLIVGLKLDPVGVAGQLGHSNPATTLRVYSHLFDRARHAEETRDRLSAGFGHLLAEGGAS
jgi:integrase